MSRSGPSLYSIAAHGGFADGLAQGLVDRFGKDRMVLARAVVILPNNRAVRAVQEAFVRLSGGGLLLPRLVAIGDPLLDEQAGAMLEGSGLGAAIPPAADPVARRFELARHIRTARDVQGNPVSATQALRLSAEFGRTLDALIVEEKGLGDLFELEEKMAPELADHWRTSLRLFAAVMTQRKERLQERGQIELAERRNRLFDHLGSAWKDTPPDHPVIAAGINSTAPAITRLLKRIAGLPHGMVVFANLDLVMTDEEWNAIDGGEDDGNQETHPQYHLKLLLDRMDVARGEVMRWNRIGPSAALAARSRALSHAFAIPERTAGWADLPGRERSLAGVRLIEASDSAQEARAIALLVREALESDGRRVAIVTADRSLGERISAQLLRWNIQVDDTAGTPLSLTPPGLLLRALLNARVTEFAPAELLALLKHPLVDPLQDRLGWLDDVRGIDLALRGPRPAAGLDAMEAALAKHFKGKQADWWRRFRAVVDPLAATGFPDKPWAERLSILSAAVSELSREQVWRGPAGRELAGLFDTLTVLGEPPELDADEWPPFFDLMMAEVAVRPPYGGHPRVQLFGLLEARLQQADLVICAGLNEGSWPQAQSPDPWLAPMVRRELGLPARDRQVGLAAHDLMTAMGAKEVVLTRAGRDASGPAVTSRFLLRLKALAGKNLREAPDWLDLAMRIDAGAQGDPAERPAPNPDAAQRAAASIAVTDVDVLTSDPYAFYAKKIMRLRSLDAVDAEPTAAWRGSAVHDVLEDWGKKDDFDPDKLIARAEAMLNDPSVHGLTRALWLPRLAEALKWIAGEVAANRQAGREPLLTEEWGNAELAGVPLKGKIDRLDRAADGGLIVVDYKTGQPPSNRQVESGHGLQLGLLGAIAEHGGFKGAEGQATGFEYWSLAKNRDGGFGFADSPSKGRANVVPADEMASHALAHFKAAVDAYILGDAPFLARIAPEYCYADYDQLMRLEEWYGRLDTQGADGKGNGDG